MLRKALVFATANIMLLGCSKDSVVQPSLSKHVGSISGRIVTGLSGKVIADATVTFEPMVYGQTVAVPTQAITITSDFIEMEPGCSGCKDRSTRQTRHVRGQAKRIEITYA